MLLKNATVYNEEFNPVRADIDVQGDKIACVGACVDSGESLDLTGYTIIPGLIDMHIMAAPERIPAIPMSRVWTPCPSAWSKEESLPSAPPP